MKKRLLAWILALVMLAALLPTAALAEDNPVAKTLVNGNETYFDTLAEAVWTADEGATVTLLKNCAGSSVKTRKPQNVTIDFNGYTYTLDEKTGKNGILPDVGSNVIMKNGAVALNSNAKCHYLIQNYANLTLDNMQIDVGENLSCETALHARNGEVNITGNTSISCDGTGGKYEYDKNDHGEKTAILIREWLDYSSRKPLGSTQVVINTTGVIRGTVFASYDGWANETSEKSTLTIKNGTIVGEIKQKATLIDESKNWHCIKTDVIVYGGSFSESVWEYVVPTLNAELESGDRYSYYEDVNAAIAAAKPGDQVSARPSDSGDESAATCSVTLKDGDAEETVITVKKNTQITLPVLTKDGYTFRGWKLDGELCTGSYTVTANVTFTAVWEKNADPSELPSWISALPALDGSKKLPFTDVWRGDWYYDGVRYVYDNDLMNGTSGTEFSPNAATTRGMIVTILARMDGVNTSGTPWYEAGREWAMWNGISDGTNMEGKITREQLAAMLTRYAALKNRDVSAIASISAYADASNVSNWAVDAMRWDVGEGLIQGSNNHLRPQSNATRAEVATILMRFCKLLKK